MSDKKNDTDRFSDKLKEIMEGYAADNIAPALTGQLVRVARHIGLPKQVVIDSIHTLWTWADDREKDGCVDGQGEEMNDK